MCRVSSFCCGCTLETGCKVIAILGLIGGVLALMESIKGAPDYIGIVSYILFLVANTALLWGTM